MAKKLRKGEREGAAKKKKEKKNGKEEAVDSKIPGIGHIHNGQDKTKKKGKGERRVFGFIWFFGIKEERKKGKKRG